MLDRETRCYSGEIRAEQQDTHATRIMRLWLRVQ